MIKTQSQTSQKWLVLVAIGTSTFMSALDTSVVNTVLPVINQAFHSTIAQVDWVVTIYLLIVSGLLLSFGRLGDMYGHKRIFLWGFGIFIMSSALCGMASTVYMLVLFRGFQAFGAAMLASNSPAILTSNFPASQRGQALGLQATMTYLGLTIAPSLGGWLTDLISWRSIFYINLPVGTLAFVLSWLFIPHEMDKRKNEKFDIPGAIFFLSGLVAMLLALNQAHVWGWGSLWIISLFTVAGISLAKFIQIERSREQPMLDLTLFKVRVFSTSVLSAILNYIAIFVILFLFPFYLIRGREFSPAEAGLILTVQPLIMAIIAPIAGTFSDRIGTKILCVLGLTILTAGLILMSRLGIDSSLTRIGFTLGIAGLGTGIFISPNNSALMGSAPGNRQGIAAGILATARSVGMVLGVGIAGAILASTLAQDSSPNGILQATQTSFLIAAGITAAAAIISYVND
jgi:EmrB/QacA subfamily drug resistance transporter